jgi:hypothetical protein
MGVFSSFIGSISATVSSLRSARSEQAQKQSKLLQCRGDGWYFCGDFLMMIPYQSRKYGDFLVVIYHGNTYIYNFRCLLSVDIF